MGTLGDEPADGAEVRLLASLISSSQLPPPRPSQAWLLRCVQSAACKRHGSARVRRRLLACERVVEEGGAGEQHLRSDGS